MKKIITQIAKEFWLPTLLAASWTILNLYVIQESQNHFIKTTTIFMAAFFLFSYFTAQYFRIKKQIRVETGLETVEHRLKKLSDEIDLKTTNLLNFQTGGDTFFYYLFDVNIEPKNWFLLNPEFIGDFPINNLRVMFLRADSNLKEHMFELKNINKTTATRANTQIQLKFDQNNRYTTSIIFSADNKTWVQLITAEKRDFQVGIHTEVFVNNEKKIDLNYIVRVYDWK